MRIAVSPGDWCCEKAVDSTGGVGVKAHNLARVVDAGGGRRGCTRAVNCREAATSVQETVKIGTVTEVPAHNLARVVDAGGGRRGCTRDVNCREAATSVQEAVRKI